MTYGRLICILCAIVPAIRAGAHPVIQHALDVTISKSSVRVEARVMMEQILLVENGGEAGAQRAPDAPVEKWPDMVGAHEKYFLSHLKIKADGKMLAGNVTCMSAPSGHPTDGGAEQTMALFGIEYALASVPDTITIDQDFLREYGWQTACVVRVRQEGGDWEMAMLAPGRTIEYGCDWSTATTAPSKGSGIEASATMTSFWGTVRPYLGLGIEHILGWEEGQGPKGLDHILFVCALVLAVQSFWDLIKVVTTFTLAHTVTLTLSVLNWVSLPKGIVEPMIAASIVAIALQNVLWPRSTRGNARLAITFAFGLFHGLGFAGGLKEAMSQLPGSTMATALGSFSLGVELGHQAVVLPLFALLFAARHWRAPHPRTHLSHLFLRYGSCAITLGGVYFLIHSFR